MTTVRHRRLESDHKMVCKLIAASGGSLVLESTSGDPPHSYVLRYHCRGVERVSGRLPVIREEHRVKIALPANYPALAPTAVMLTPIFHPHVFPNSVICLGRRWTPAEYLDSLVLRIGAIIQCDPRYFDFSSAANRAAADWAQANMHLFPTGDCSFKSSVAGAAGEISWTNIQ